MKKKSILIIFVLALVCFLNDVGAKVVTNPKIKIEYNNTTKELYAYGYNMQGNLGTGNTEYVDQTNKVNINNKIGNQKIIDYIFTDAQSYILTENGNVYASGFHLGDGNDKDIRTTFRKLVLYNSNLKVVALKLISNNNSCLLVNKDRSLKCDIHMDMLTNNKNIKYSINHFRSPTKPLIGSGSWNRDYLLNEYRYGANKSNYIMYKDTKNKNKFSEVLFDYKGKKMMSYNINKTKKTIVKNNYSNGVITQSKYMSEKKQIIKKYNKGIIKSQSILNYSKTKKNYMYFRFLNKMVNYSYKNGKAKIRTIKKLSNKKIRVSSVKFYYRNSKGELKSNKNGKARAYITYYKKGKAKVTYRYDYNKKGKMVNKKQTKLRV